MNQIPNDLLYKYRELVVELENSLCLIMTEIDSIKENLIEEGTYYHAEDDAFIATVKSVLRQASISIDRRHRDIMRDAKGLDKIRSK